MRLLDGGLEGDQEVFADDAFGVIAGRGVGAALGLAVYGEVLGGGHHVVVVDMEIVALQAGDGGHGHARDKVRVFAVGLFGAAPARIAGDIENRSEDLSDAGGASLVAGGGEDAANQGRIESAGQPEDLREAGAAVGHETVQRFAHEQPGNAEAGFLAEIALHGIAQDGGLARRVGRVVVIEAVESQVGLIGFVSAGGIDQGSVRGIAAADFGDLFLESHATEQVRHALIDGELGVAILGRGLRGGCRLARRVKREEKSKTQKREDEEVSMATWHFVSPIGRRGILGRRVRPAAGGPTRMVTRLGSQYDTTGRRG